MYYRRYQFLKIAETVFRRMPKIVSPFLRAVTTVFCSLTLDTTNTTGVHRGFESTSYPGYTPLRLGQESRVTVVVAQTPGGLFHCLDKNWIPISIQLYLAWASLDGISYIRFVEDLSKASGIQFSRIVLREFSGHCRWELNGCSGLYWAKSDIVIPRMSYANQIDRDVLNRLESAAERVAKNDADQAHLRRPTAQYLSRAHIPSAVMTAKSLGRISFGREYAHKKGVVVFVPEDWVDLDELQRLNQADVLSPPEIGVYRNVDAGGFEEIRNVANGIVTTISDEIKMVDHYELKIKGRICNHTLPCVILALEHLPHAKLRWRGPGSEGRVQIDEELEGVRGFAAWIPPSCLPPDAKLEDIARACGAEKQGRSFALKGLEV